MPVVVRMFGFVRIIKLYIHKNNIVIYFSEVFAEDLHLPKSHSEQYFLHTVLAWWISRQMLNVFSMSSQL